MICKNSAPTPVVIWVIWSRDLSLSMAHTVKINQMPPQIIHIMRFSFWIRCPRFCNEMYRGRGCSVANNLKNSYGSLIQVYNEHGNWHTPHSPTIFTLRKIKLLHFWTGGSEWCTDCHGSDIKSGKDNNQQNLSKMIMRYRIVCNKIASDVWRYK